MIMFHESESRYVPCSSASDLTTAEEEAQNPGSTRYRGISTIKKEGNNIKQLPSKKRLYIDNSYQSMGRNMYIDTAEYEGVYQISVMMLMARPSPLTSLVLTPSPNSRARFRTRRASRRTSSA